MTDKYNNLQKDLDEVKAWLQKELKQISTGQANAGILDSVYVDAYGSKMLVTHVASISMDGNSLKVSPFDKSTLKDLEQGIRDADLGVSILSESDCVRVIFPQLTTETRAKFVKIAKEKLEDARIKVRQIRADVNVDIDSQKIAGNISEDDAKAKKDKVQQSVDETNIELQSLFATKEAAILKI